MLSKNQIESFWETDLYQSISWSTSIQIWIGSRCGWSSRKCAKLTLKNQEIKFAALLSKNQIESFWETDYTSQSISWSTSIQIWIGSIQIWIGCGLKPRKCAKLTLKNHKIKFAPLLSKNQIESFWETDYTSRFLVNKYSNLNRKSMWLKPRKCAKLTLKNHEIKFMPIVIEKIDWIFGETDYTSRAFGQQDQIE